jgi:hypothetical protein
MKIINFRRMECAGHRNHEERKTCMYIYIYKFCENSLREQADNMIWKNNIKNLEEIDCDVIDVINLDHDMHNLRLS